MTSTSARSRIHIPPMIRYSTPWALNASKSCYRSSGRVIGYSLESVGCDSRIPYSSKPFAHRAAPSITVDLSLLFLMAGESADYFIRVHEIHPRFYYIPFPLSRLTSNTPSNPEWLLGSSPAGEGWRLRGWAGRRRRCPWRRCGGPGRRDNRRVHRRCARQSPRRSPS